MRGAIKAGVLASLITLLWFPAEARAEGYVSPFAGVHFGNSALEKKFVWGGQAGYMGAGIIGAELDFGWAPNAFDEPTDNHVMDLMGNLIIGVPVGGTRGAGVRPYVTGGLGMIQSKIASGVSGIPDTDNKDFGFNVGGGVMGYFSDHFGLRGDVRYFRTFSSDNIDSLLHIDFGGFDFWRGSIGVVIR